MRRGLASARWNIALICARTGDTACLPVAALAKAKERKGSAGETNRPFDVIISPREEPWSRSPMRLPPPPQPSQTCQRALIVAEYSANMLFGDFGGDGVKRVEMSMLIMLIERM
jgi:hypothetical protein